MKPPFLLVGVRNAVAESDFPCRRLPVPRPPGTETLAPAVYFNGPAAAPADADGDSNYDDVVCLYLTYAASKVTSPSPPLNFAATLA